MVKIEGLKPFKIATWNVNSLKVRLGHLQRWLTEQQPDIVALQETKITDEQFPVSELQALGYHLLYSGQKAYNGVAMLAKLPMTEPVVGLPNFPDSQRRTLTATINHCRIINVYVPNGYAVGSEKFIYKLQWLAALIDFVKEQLQHFEYLVVLGDFNIAPAEDDVHDPIFWEGKVLFSEPERALLAELLSVGLVDSFRLFPQLDKTFSWWDYRGGAFWRNAGLRIDHIFLSKALAKYCRRCLVDKEPRKWQRPSDHAPVIAEIDFVEHFA